MEERGARVAWPCPLPVLLEVGLMNWPDEAGFEIRGADNMNVSECSLYKAMLRLGFDPIPQYRFSRCTLDFAFPEERLAVEVNGPEHYTECGQERDRRRYAFLNSNGWAVRAFTSSQAYRCPDQSAERIKEILEGNESPQTAYPGRADRRGISGFLVRYSIAGMFSGLLAAYVAYLLLGFTEYMGWALMISSLIAVLFGAALIAGLLDKARMMMKNLAGRKELRTEYC